MIDGKSGFIKNLLHLKKPMNHSSMTLHLCWNTGTVEFSCIGFPFITHRIIFSRNNECWRTFAHDWETSSADSFLNEKHMLRSIHVIAAVQRAPSAGRRWGGGVRGGVTIEGR